MSITTGKRKLRGYIKRRYSRFQSTEYYQGLKRSFHGDKGINLSRGHNSVKRLCKKKKKEELQNYMMQSNRKNKQIKRPVKVYYQTSETLSTNLT